jgi:hypothetical protein
MLPLLIFAALPPSTMQHELPSVGPVHGVAVSSIDLPADGRFVDAAGRARILYVHKGAGLMHAGRMQIKLNAERAVIVPAESVATLTTTQAMQIVRFELTRDSAKIVEATLGRRDDKTAIPLASGFARAQPLFSGLDERFPWQLAIVDATEDAVVKVFSGEKGGEIIVPVSGRVTVRREGARQARDPFTAFVADKNVAHRVVSDGHSRWLLLASAHTMAMIERDRSPSLANGFGGVEAEGALDAYVVQLGVEKGLPLLSSCYKDALGDNLYFAGELRARFVIEANGKVKDVAMEHASIGNVAVQRCIADVLAGLEFPKSKNKKTTLVSYPFVLTP